MIFGSKHRIDLIDLCGVSVSECIRLCLMIDKRIEGLSIVAVICALGNCSAALAAHLLSCFSFSGVRTIHIKYLLRAFSSSACCALLCCAGQCDKLTTNVCHKATTSMLFQPQTSEESKLRGDYNRNAGTTFRRS